MSDAPQGRPSEPSLGASLLRHVGGAVVLVALVSGVFWVIGTLERSDDGELAAESADEPVDGTEEAEQAPTTQPPAEPDEPDPADPPDDDPDDAESDDGAEGTDEPDADDDTDADGGPDDVDDGHDEQPSDEPTIEPSTISVQVLDGYQADGGAAANAVAAELRDAGYDVVAQNPALRYEITTVLWTPGHEAEARQVATEIGAPEAREQSGNLSSRVAVHVVVGSDRG